MPIRRSLLGWSLLPYAASQRMASGQETDFTASKIVRSSLRYEYGEFDGRPIYVASHFRQINPSLLQDCLSVITGTLRDLGTKVPAAAWAKLHKVPVWLEYEDALFPGGCYHESKTWVVAHGYEPAKTGGVQFTKNISLWHRDQPMMLMHELAHVYHHDVLTYE